jgi:hypothetical protein
VPAPTWAGLSETGIRVSEKLGYVGVSVVREITVRCAVSGETPAADIAANPPPVASATVSLLRNDPVQLVWTVKEFGGLQRDHKNDFPSLPQSAASGGRLGKGGERGATAL